MSRWILPTPAWPLMTPSISLAVAVACLMTFDDFGLSDTLWKFPNDLYGKTRPSEGASRMGKLGGILVEVARKRDGALTGWIAGIGINLRPFDESFPENLPLDIPPLSLSDLSPSKILGFGPVALTTHLSRRIGDILRNKDPEEVRSILEGRLLWKDQWVAYRLQGELKIGQIVALGEEGNLILKDHEGKKEYLGPSVRKMRPLEVCD